MDVHLDEEYSAREAHPHKQMPAEWASETCHLVDYISLWGGNLSGVQKNSRGLYAVNPYEEIRPFVEK